ncbi:hypothetical protein SBRCBS47491_008591 [Sporothrix bragantina]|uniref:Dolichyldiphosphatase n=1 Tax=Sporothrix bragantina TaxID=671064 RepID=A0ABP0CMM8_9PEZI
MDSEPIALASLSLTHVYYDPNDFISYICAWLALVPQAIIIVYVTLVWSTREAEVLLAFAGQLVCEAVNFVLKRIIKEERPQHNYHASMLASLLGGVYDNKNDGSSGAAAAGQGSGEAGAIASGAGLNGSQRLPIRGGYGMPSSHAQFAGFWALTIALFLLVRYESKKSTTTSATSKTARGGAAVVATPWHKRTSMSLFERIAASIAAFIVAFFIAWSRVYLHYHTPRQVLVGFAAGLVVGAGWFGVTSVARYTGLLDWGLQLPPAQYLRFRDLVLEEDPLQPGWEKWQAQLAAQDSKKKL